MVKTRPPAIWTAKIDLAFVRGLFVVTGEERFQGDEVVVGPDKAAVRRPLVGIVQGGLVRVGVERPNNLHGLSGHGLCRLGAALFALPDQAGLAGDGGEVGGRVGQKILLKYHNDGGKFGGMLAKSFPTESPSNVM